MEEFSTVRVYCNKYPQPGDRTFESTTYVNFGLKSVIRTTRQFIDKKGNPKLVEIYTPLFDFFDNLDGETKRTQKEVDEFFTYLESYKDNYKDIFYDNNIDDDVKIYIEIDNIQYPYNTDVDEDEYERARYFIEDTNPLYGLTNKMFLNLSKKWRE